MPNNGSNARLDRIEKLIEQGERLSKEAHARHKQEIKEIREIGAKSEREIAELRTKSERDIAEINAHIAEINAHIAEINAHTAEIDADIAEHRRHMAADLRKTRDYLRRWAALGVQEARNQRKRHQKLDADIGRLVSSQLETEAMLKGLISALKTGGNGGPRPS
jgi:chromosome segregation ATPase